MSAIDFDPTGIDTTFMLDPGESSEAPGRLSSANTVSSGVSVPNKSSQKFFNDPLSADVIILSGPRKIYVHREDLERASPYFKAMLSGRFKESTASEIKLEDDDPDAVFDMLHFIYCFHDPIKAFWFEVPNELVSLMITADKYQISKLG
ncbi:Hypothetical protein D9617_3g021350 [Elsinoe fawcettii]|nr:Hypothetical protein D9617_3g021350 [Elsinoe fawcettii]